MIFLRGVHQVICITAISLGLVGCALKTCGPDQVRKPSALTNIPILLYHHVQDIPQDATASLRRWSLTPQQFEAHLDWIIQQGLHPMTMVELIEHLTQGKPLPANAIGLTFDDGWKDHYAVVFPALVKRHMKGTFFITTDSVGHSAFVSWDQLKEMSAAGMDIQSHSLTHPHLDRVPFAQVSREVIESKKSIEDHLNGSVKVFAYPYGGYNTDVLRVTRRAGYQGATTVRGMNHGFVQPANNVFTLPRLAVTGEDTVSDIADLIYGYYRWSKCL